VAVSHFNGALAFVRRPLGRGMVHQLAAASPSHRASRPGCNSCWDLVCWRCWSGPGHDADRDSASRVPIPALACLAVARGTRLHRHRTCSTPGPSATGPTQLLQRARVTRRSVFRIFEGPWTSEHSPLNAKRTCARIFQNHGSYVNLSLAQQAFASSVTPGNDNDQGGRRLWIRSDATYLPRAPRRPR